MLAYTLGTLAPKAGTIRNDRFLALPSNLVVPLVLIGREKQRGRISQNHLGGWSDVVNRRSPLYLPIARALRHIVPL